MKKVSWNRWEQIALDYYLGKWYGFIDKNVYFKGWEIDLILSHKSGLVFVEVKVVDGMDDYFWYLTPKKLQNFKKSVKLYMSSVGKMSYDYIRCDFVLVKNGQILESFENEFI